MRGWALATKDDKEATLLGRIVRSESWRGGGEGREGGRGREVGGAGVTVFEAVLSHVLRPKRV